MSGGEERQERPETAGEEVLREMEEAGKRDGQGDGGGEAADAITPNTQAQEQSQGD